VVAAVKTYRNIHDAQRAYENVEEQRHMRELAEADRHADESLTNELEEADEPAAEPDDGGRQD
jgi:hypothetical protein